MNKLKKRHFYNGIDYIIDEKEQVLILNKEFHDKLLNKKLWNSFGFKKITGSSIGDVVLPNDKFKSKFKAFANICYLNLPILDPIYVEAGISIEPKVIDAIEKTLKCEVERFFPELYEYDYFKNTDTILGGLPDGYIKEKNILIEIKTTKETNMESWKKFGIPASYLKQAQLYTYLMNSEYFVIVATFLKDEDYENPNDYPIEKRKIESYKFKLNKEQTEDDIIKAKNWYIKYTQMGISPKYDVNNDKEILEYLKCHNEQEWISLLDKWHTLGKVKVEYK